MIEMYLSWLKYLLKYLYYININSTIIISNTELQNNHTKLNWNKFVFHCVVYIYKTASLSNDWILAILFMFVVV